ncbi:MAG: PaaI family thioesterase [Chloroflexi bacterium]|nr:MAG: PaaI family thioesterase [Chloroflexota bacterium]
MSDGGGLGEVLHRSCVVCGRQNARGLGVRYAPQPDGSCTGTFDCDASFQGYDGVLHGGVVAALLDGAMAHCLLYRERVAHTGNFSMRFRHPVLVGQPVTVRGFLLRSRIGAHVMSAELSQEGCLKVTASATFIEGHFAGGGGASVGVPRTEVPAQCPARGSPGQ